MCVCVCVNVRYIIRGQFVLRIFIWKSPIPLLGIHVSVLVCGHLFESIHYTLLASCTAFIIPLWLGPTTVNALHAPISIPWYILYPAHWENGHFLSVGQFDPHITLLLFRSLSLSLYNQPYPVSRATTDLNEMTLWRSRGNKSRRPWRHDSNRRESTPRSIEHVSIFREARAPFN